MLTLANTCGEREEEEEEEGLFKADAVNWRRRRKQRTQQAQEAPLKRKPHSVRLSHWSKNKLKNIPKTQDTQRDFLRVYRWRRHLYLLLKRAFAHATARPHSPAFAATDESTTLMFMNCPELFVD